MKISLDDFNDLTPKEFDEALKALHTIKTNESQYQIQLNFEVARFIVVQIWNSAGKSLKTDIKDAKEAFPFPWEKESEPKVQTIEEMKKQFQIIAAAFSNKPETKKK